MSAEVVGLRGAVAVKPGEPNPTLVRELENMLERAKAGELIGIAVATFHSDRASAYAVIGHVGTYGMIGALDCAKAHLIKINTRED